MGYYRTGAFSYARGRALPRMGYKPRRPYPNPGGQYKRPRNGAPVRQGQRVRRSGRTATYTRRKRRVNRIVKHGDNASASYTTMRSKWNRYLKTLFRVVQGRQTRVTQNSFSATCGTGTQGVLSESHLLIPELVAMATAANDGTATNNANRLFIGHVKVKMSFKNQSNAVGKLLIYDLVCKKSSPSLSLDTPQETWQKGLTDFGAGVSANTIIGATPNQSPEFRNYWKIRKVTPVMLEPGQQHEHIVYRSINKVYDSTYWANNAGQSIAWLTGSIMFVWHGSLIHESATPSTVTYSDMRLDYARTMETSFGFMKQNLPSYTATATFPVTITDPDFMGESGDVDANVTNA